MPVSQAAVEQYHRQQRRALSAVLLARREWDTIGSDFDAGWERIGPRIAALVASAQFGAAEDGSRYVPAALAAIGQSALAVALVKPRAFAGLSSDGLSIESLLYGSVIRAKQADAKSLVQRLDVGRRHLDALVQTSVADAGRDATSAAITVRPRVLWVRQVNPPCCQRCAVLSGRVYSYAQTFQRHPRCDCIGTPMTVANPDAAGRTIGPNDVTDLTKRQRAAIDKGADFNKVINSYNTGDDYHVKQAGPAATPDSTAGAANSLFDRINQGVLDKGGRPGDYLPPTRVDRVTAEAGSRDKAIEALRQLGYVAA